MMNRLIATTLLSTAVAFSAQAQDVTGTIHANQGTQKIYKEIYGQFAEHLGSCIYGGLWVGPDSKIPNTQGYRNDVLQALSRPFCRRSFAIGVSPSLVMYSTHLASSSTVPEPTLPLM